VVITYRYRNFPPPTFSTALDGATEYTGVCCVGLSPPRGITSA